MASYAKKLSADTVSIFAARGIGLALGILRIKVITTSLGVQLFGVYSFALYFVLLFSLLYELGIHHIVVREVSKNRSLSQRYVVGALTLKAMLSALSLIGVMLAVALSGFSAETTLAVILTFAISVTQSFGLIFSGLFQAHQRMRTVSLFSFATETGITIVVVVLLWSGYRLFGVLAGTLLVSVVSLAVQMYVAGRVYGIRWALPEKMAAWRSIVAESYPIALSSVGVAAYLYLSSSLIGYMKGEIAVGYFGIGLKIISVLSVIPASVTQVFFPVLSELHESGSPKLESVFETSVRFLLTLSIPLSVGTILLAPALISLLFSDEFLPAGDSLRLLMVANILTYPNWLIYAFLTSVNRQKFQMYMTLSVGVCVTIVNLLLIPAYGILASSASILAAEVILFAGALIYLRAIRYPLSLRRLFLSPVLATGAMSAVVLLTAPMPLFARATLGFFTYIIAFIFSGGLRENDRIVLRTILPWR